MSDLLFALVGFTLAGLLIVPAAIFVRWLELKAETRRVQHTPAE